MGFSGGGERAISYILPGRAGEIVRATGDKALAVYKKAAIPLALIGTNAIVYGARNLIRTAARGRDLPLPI